MGVVVAYQDAFSVDEYTDQSEKFVNKIVVLNATLAGYRMESGWLSCEVQILLRGEIECIAAYCKVSSFHRENQKLKLYFEAFFGKVVGLKLCADTHKIKAIKFGETEFKIWG